MRPIYVYGVTNTDIERRVLRAAMRDAGLENAEIAQKKVEDPNAVVVTLGDQALRVYTYKINTAQSHGYVLNEEGMPTIVPAIHPSIVAKTLEDYVYFVWSFKKAKMIANGEGSPKREFILKPSLEQTLDYIEKCKSADTICLDIEKEIKDPQRMTCLGIALSETSAISIPFWAGTSNYWSPGEEALVRQKLQELLSSTTVNKVIHNYIFDTLCLDYLYDLQVSFPIFDTMLAAHIIHPNLKKGLKELARLYTFVEPWKGGQDWSAKQNVMDLWKYNAQDTAVTFEIYNQLMDTLKATDLLQVYNDRVSKIMPLVYNICREGMAVDLEAMKNVELKMKDILTPTDARLTELCAELLPIKVKYVQRKIKKPEVQYYKGVGDPTYTRKTDGEIKEIAYKTYEPVAFDSEVKSFRELDYPVFECVRTQTEYNPNSVMQMRQVLRAIGVDIPTKIDKENFNGEKEVTGHKEMLKLARKYPGNEVINLYLNRGKAQKIKSTYSKLDLDPDNRFRFSMNIAGTKSGRMSSSKTAWKTGGNIQNMPRDGDDSNYAVRQIFVPSAGYTDLVQVDLSQAEARVVTWLAKDEHAMGMFERGEDIHTWTANAILGEDITVYKGTPMFKEKRDLGKLTRHALSYGMGPYLFADKVLIDTGKMISIQESKDIIQAYFAANYKVREWQQDMERLLNVEKKLVSPHGRQIEFYGRIDEKVVREALSWIPQSVVGDCLYEAWGNLEKLFTEDSDHKHRILMQGHDSLLIETNNVEECKKAIDLAFKTVKVTIDGVQRQIPWEISVGKNWRDVQ